MDPIAVAALLVSAIATYLTYLQLRRTPKQRPAHTPIELGEQPVALLESAHAVRHNLPPRELFIGRRSERARVVEGLTSSYPLLAIEGLGGMGKTALAREIAWTCTLVEAVDDASGPSSIHDAVAWISDREGRLTLNDVLDTIASVLDYGFILSLPFEAKRQEVNKLLRDHPCLVVIDNFDTVVDDALAAFIASIPAPSKALVTSRERLLRGAWAIVVGKMECGDAFELIRNEGRRLGLQSIQEAGVATLDAVYEASGGNPLAIRLSLGMLRNSGLSLDEVLTRLTAADDDELFDTVFNRDWNELLKDDQDSKLLLMTLAILPGPTAKEAIEAGSDVHHAHLRVSMQRLIELSLVDVDELLHGGSQRFHLHPLTRAFVRKQMTALRGEEEAIETRLVSYFLVYAENRADTYGKESHIKELDAERNSILEFAELATRRARARGDPADLETVVRYSTAMSAFLWGRGYWGSELKLCEDAIEACRKLDNRNALARQLCNKGRIHLWRGNLVVAQECCDASCSALSEMDDPAAAAMALRLQAQIATRRGEFESAEALLQQVLEFAPMTVDDTGRAATLIELGIVAAKQSKWMQARERFQEALRLDEQMGTVEGEAVTLSHLGSTMFALTEISEAKRLFERGLALANQVKRISTAGRCQVGLAKISLQLGDYGVASAFAEAAREKFAKLGMTDMVAEASDLISIASSGSKGLTELDSSS